MTSYTDYSMYNLILSVSQILLSVTLLYMDFNEVALDMLQQNQVPINANGRLSIDFSGLWIRT